MNSLKTIIFLCFICTSVQNCTAQDTVSVNISEIYIAEWTMLLNNRFQGDDALDTDLRVKLEKVIKKGAKELAKDNSDSLVIVANENFETYLNHLYSLRVKKTLKSTNKEFGYYEVNLVLYREFTLCPLWPFC